MFADVGPPDNNLTKRIDLYCPEASESPSLGILTTFDFASFEGLCAVPSKTCSMFDMLCML